MNHKEEEGSIMYMLTGTQEYADAIATMPKEGEPGFDQDAIDALTEKWCNSLRYWFADDLVPTNATMLLKHIMETETDLAKIEQRFSEIGPLIESAILEHEMWQNRYC